MLRILKMFIGRRCSVCSTVIDSPGPGIVCCSVCTEQLSMRLGGFCGMCARLYALEDDSTHLCLDCRARPFSWRGISFFSTYNGLLRDMILKYKFNADLGLGFLLGDLLFQAVSAHPYELMDCLVPVPLHEKRLSERGFNQSLELCRIVAGKTGLAVKKDALIKVVHTPPQSSLGRKVRLKSLAKAFRPGPEDVKGQKVILVDDIMTTGSTLEQCTRSLLKAGASEVRVVFLARTT